jgi:hypothetical protein
MRDSTSHMVFQLDAPPPSAVSKKQPDSLTAHDRMRRFVLTTLALLAVLGCQRAEPTHEKASGSQQEHAAVRTVSSSSAGNGNPIDILDQAIAAYGGQPAREKLKRCRIASRCITRIPAIASEAWTNAIIEDSFSYPDKWRRVVRSESDGKEVLLSVLNAGDLWARFPGKRVQTMPLPGANMRKPAVIATLDQLTALRESKEVIVVGRVRKADGHELVPLTVESDGQDQSTTYFDCSTHLIEKVEKHYLPDVTGPRESISAARLASTETTYGDYKSFEGVVLPTRMKVSQAGKTILDMSILKVEFPTTFDADTFQKPKDK